MFVSLFMVIQSLVAEQVSSRIYEPYYMDHNIWSISYDNMLFLQDFIRDFGVFGDYVCEFGSYADLEQVKSVCKDGLNFLECDIGGDTSEYHICVGLRHIRLSHLNF